MMRLRVLVDNCALIDRYYLAEPAVSYLIEADGLRLLFDAGYSDVYLRNAASMGEDLSRLDYVVISHGHDDHTGGLAYWPASNGRPALAAHPDAFDPKRHGELSIGSPLSREELAARFELRLTREPLWLSPRLAFLGQIPRLNEFEGLKPVGERLMAAGPADGGERAGDGGDGGGDGGIGRSDGASAYEPDFVLDDSALAWKGDDGLVVVSGCSHAGIVNIVEYAMELCGERRLAAVIGGFHLLEADGERLRRSAERLAALAPRAVYAAHCTDLAAKIRLAAELPIRELGVGSELVYY